MTIVSKPGAGRPQRILTVLATLAVVVACAVVRPAHAGYATIVVDAQSGEVFDAVGADQENIPASLTKMMTLYLTFQALQNGRLKLDQSLPVSALAANKAPTKLDLRAGQGIRVRDCILGMIVKSANDAATVVAEGIGGSEPGFVKQMNAQAALLGMNGTHFGNASGLPDPGNRTTARDMAKLGQALYRDFPQQAPLFATDQFLFRGHVVRGHNRLMARYAGMDGLKTGYTDASGFNLASTAVRGGRRLFAVVLGGRTAASRDDEMAYLLDDVFGQAPLANVRMAKASAPAAAKMVRVAATKSSSRRPAATCSPAAKKRLLAQKKAHGKSKKPAMLAMRDAG